MKSEGAYILCLTTSGFCLVKYILWLVVMSSGYHLTKSGFSLVPGHGHETWRVSKIASCIKLPVYPGTRVPGYRIPEIDCGTRIHGHETWRVSKIASCIKLPTYPGTWVSVWDTYSGTSLTEKNSLKYPGSLIPWYRAQLDLSFPKLRRVFGFPTHLPNFSDQSKIFETTPRLSPDIPRIIGARGGCAPKHFVGTRVPGYPGIHTDTMVCLTWWWSARLDNTVAEVKPYSWI